MKFLRAFFLVFAIILAGSVVYVIGPTKIITNFQLVGWKMGWVFVIGFPRYFIYTLAWKIFLPNEAYTLNRLFQIKVAGELITRSTPIHFVGGDTARVFLMGKNIPRKEAAGSVVMDRTVMTLGAAVVVLMGLVIATFKLPLPLLPKISLWVLVGLIFWGLFFIISHQKRTAFTSVLNLLSKIGFKRWIRPSWKEKVASMDEIIRGYYNRGHGILAPSLLLGDSRLRLRCIS
jgi:hypothetical protein